MTIQYIRHEQEFYGVIKLKTGDTLLGSMIATQEDDNPDKTVFYIQEPATPNMHQVEKDGQMGMAVGLLKWMMFADEDFYMVNEDDIITVAPMSMDSILMYKMWVRKECKTSKTDVEVKMNPNMGLVGKVSDFRSKLEDFWKRTNS
jgi:hypothetical protein|tara:strand:- start:1398 stop:1835 length:438 start_codon:yes stop_codon:yes gene_type:complete